jgi:hypothetical protein
MRTLVAVFLFAGLAAAQQLKPIPADDATRVREFYRLTAQVQDQIWPGWGSTPAPLLLITSDTEYLTHRPSPPAEFKKIADEFYARPRQFPLNLLATFPAFGPPSVIVIGEPANTSAQTSTPWLITVMHEHFHQLQYSQPDYFKKLDDLGLSHGDKSGMWALNYAFAYDNPEVAQSFAKLRDQLLQTLAEQDPLKFHELSSRYLQARRAFFAQLPKDDGKYFSFQLWQEGMARYTQVRVAEAVEKYQPTKNFSALPDYTPFSRYGASARVKTLEELKQVDLSRDRRDVVYSFGAAEGFLLDRIHPGWQQEYFQHMLTTEPLFPQ